MSIDSTNILKQISGAARQDCKNLLRDVIGGSQADRLAYCIERAAVQARFDLLLYGSAEIDKEKTKRRIVHWFKRLERLSELAASR